MPKTDNGNPNVSYAVFDEHIVRDMMATIDNFFGDVFTIRRVATHCGISGSKLARYMHHLLNCNAVKVADIHRNPSGDVSYRYVRNFYGHEIEGLLKIMEKNDNLRRER